MKICPKCAFSNGEEYATCVWCNTSLAEVPSTKPEDPNDPEYEKWKIRQKRYSMLRRQLAGAVVFYALIIAWSTLAGTGYTWVTGMMLWSFASGLLVGGGLARGILGQLTGGLAQAVCSVAIVVNYGLGSLIMIFSLAAHIFFAVLFGIWIELIYDANR